MVQFNYRISRRTLWNHKKPLGSDDPQGLFAQLMRLCSARCHNMAGLPSNSCIIRELRILPIMLMTRLTNISSKDICGTSLPCRISLMRAVAHLVYHTNFIRGKRILVCSYLAKMVYCNHSLFVLIVYLIQEISYIEGILLVVQEYRMKDGFLLYVHPRLC